MRGLLNSEVSNQPYPRIVISGLRGGEGKTFLSLALIASYREKGFSIAPFKKGPDYIDSGWLSFAAGYPCYNLDLFMIGKEQLLSSFKRRAAGAHCSIIEGNRGLFDGMDPEGKYSTAELAKLLNAPVVLIIDCTKMTKTAAIITAGICGFDPDLKIRGVILNQIANSRHERVIRESFKKYCKVPILGAIPRLPEEFLPERYTGLVPPHEHKEAKGAISAISEIAKEYLDLDTIWKIANEADPLPADIESSVSTQVSLMKSCDELSLKVGIIKDLVYYPENLEELRKKGVTLVEISALKDRQLPRIDALYIGGGFSETYAIALADNFDFRNNLKKAVENNLPLYAEGSSLMYLGESFVAGDRTYPMTAVFPVKFCLEKKPQAHGYTVVEVSKPNPYYPSGTTLRGHEFHYCRLLNPDVTSEFGLGNGVYFAFRMKRGKGIVNRMDGLCYKNVLATYTHLHALGAPEWIDGFINVAASYRKEAHNG